MTASRVPVLGVDIGGVIVSRQHDNEDTSFFGPNFLKTPPVEGVFEALNRLVRVGFRTYLVSKCGENVEKKTRLWLADRDFYTRTGVPESNVRFCRTRDGKAPICRELGVTHFVDDRLEVLSYLETVPHLYLFDGNEREVQRFAQFLPRVRRVSNWKELTAILLK